MSHGVLRFAFLALFSAMLTAPGPSVHADAGADLQKAESLMKRAEVNLQSVESGVRGRTSPPRGSAGKLLAQRLAQAKGDLDPAGQLLANVPDATEGAAAAKQRHADAVALHDGLYAFLTGENAPATDDSAGTKLDYKQEKLLKDARFYMNEVQQKADGLTALHAQLLPIEDQTTINHKVVFTAMNDLARAKDRAALVKERLDQLPADGAGVAPVVQQYNAAVEAINGADSFFTPLAEKLHTLTAPANYPDFEADYKRLAELGGMYSRPENLEQNRVEAAIAVRQSNAAYQEMARIVAKYKPIIDQQTDQGDRMAGQMKWFLDKYQAYAQAAQATATTLPGQIRADVAEAQQYADQAVAEQKPMFFQGGIPQRFGWADEKLALLEALDADAHAAMTAEVQAAKDRINEQERSLATAIIESNPLPPDNFQGPDRDAAIAIAVDGWKGQQPEFELLGVRVPSQAWERSTRWEWFADAFHHVDVSTLQVQLLVADESNPELAIIRPVNVKKDHNKGDTMIGVPLWSIEDDVQPRSYLKRDKIR
ncbi:MAG: hypothetical protein AAGE65_01315 [Planctomycetota bacterium]